MMHQLIHGEISARLKIPSLPNLYQEMYSCARARGTPCTMTTEIRYQMLSVPAAKRLVRVEPQPYFRGTLVIAEDTRHHFICISHSMGGLQRAIAAIWR